MDITRTASGAIKITSNGGGVFFLTNLQNAKTSNTASSVNILSGDRSYDFPIAGLTINGVAFVGTSAAAAESIATTVVTKV